MPSVWDIITQADSVVDLISDLVNNSDKDDEPKPAPSPKPKTPKPVSPPKASLPEDANKVITDMAYLHPQVRIAAQKAIKECENNGYTITVLETYRSNTRQSKLYAQGRTEPGEIVTKAQSGQSYHNYGLALDISPVDEYVGSVFESYGFEWGARWKSFKDMPHFQMTFGYTIAQLKNIMDDCNNLQVLWEQIS